MTKNDIASYFHITQTLSIVKIREMKDVLKICSFHKLHALEIFNNFLKNMIISMNSWKTKSRFSDWRAFKWYLWHCNIYTYIHIYIYIYTYVCVCVCIHKSVKLVTLVEGDPKAPFSITTTPRCRRGCYSFLLIAPLYPCSLPYNTEC